MKIKSLIFGLGCGLLLVSVFFYFVYGASAKSAGNVVSAELTNDEIIERARGLGMVFLLENTSARGEQVSALSDDAIIGRALELGMTLAAPQAAENEPLEVLEADETEPSEAETDGEENPEDTEGETQETEGETDKDEPEETQPEQTDETQPTQPNETAQTEPAQTNPTQTQPTQTQPQPTQPAQQPAPTQQQPAPSTEPDDLNALNRPAVSSNGENNAASKNITITIGQTASDVARNLLNAGVISDTGDFLSYLNKNGAANKIIIGTYEFSPGEDYSVIMNQIAPKR